MEWYQERCDGLWEHGPGIVIETLDNPGWTIKIYIRDTPWENVRFEAIKVDKTDDDWLHCFVREGYFEAAGDPSKLPTMLQHFLQFVGKL